MQSTHDQTFTTGDHGTSNRPGWEIWVDKSWDQRGTTVAVPIGTATVVKRGSAESMNVISVPAGTDYYIGEEAWNATESEGEK